MAKVAIHDFSSLVSFPFEKCVPKVQADATMKRKTPSELRGEQLKRKRCASPSHESSASLPCSGSTSGVVHGVKKVESSKTPKYIDTRVDEVYPVKKSSDMFRLLYGKEKAKNTSSAKQISDLKSSETAKTPDASDCATASAKESVEQVQVEKCNQNTFRNVAELSMGGRASSGPGIIDMDKVLKGFVARELPPISSLLADSSGGFSDVPSISLKSSCSSLHIPGASPPLDFTLKSNMRLISSSSMSWFHRLTATSGYEGMSHFMSQFSHAQDRSIQVGRSLGISSKAELLHSKSLHLWSYPQSSLPSTVVSAMSLCAARGGSTETDFLSRRQLAWADSFRSLYYLLRRNMCSIFYLYTSHFVVMFTGGNFEGKMKYSCNAYVSQSTRGLRALLREHDVQFSMPLCRSKVEQATSDDLIELTEFEKKNPGQTHHLDFMSHVDNSSQSLLACIGNENVHGLYDFLLNYRSFLHFLANVDVPALYSPVPFQNASLCMPEIRCKQMKRADAALLPPRDSHVDDGEVSSGICYSVEIKDAILPPWIVNRICMAMGSEVSSFEASFTTDPLSTGLNFALISVCGEAPPLTDSGQESPQNGSAFGFTDTIVDSRLQSASLKSLKFSKGSYFARVSPA